MNRKAFCQACHNENFGVKTRIAVPHTCGRHGSINEQQETERLRNLGQRQRNKINAYVCHDLHATVTEDIEEGVTPMFILCPKCNALGAQNKATSMMYQVNQMLFPTHEWYKPTADDWKELAAEIYPPAVQAMRDHVEKGGLLLRPIAKTINTIQLLGKPETIGALRKLLEIYPDDMSFGFRNQPMQELLCIRHSESTCICFQESVSEMYGKPLY